MSSYRVICLSDAPQARISGAKAQPLPWGVLNGARLIAAFATENEADAYCMRRNRIAAEMGEMRV